VELLFTIWERGMTTLRLLAIKLQHTTPSTKAIRLQDILHRSLEFSTGKKFFVKKKLCFQKGTTFYCGEGTINAKPQLEIFC
jgi:hypothetical protein